MKQITVSGYIPGAIGKVTELHAAYYFPNWNFGLYFEAKVAMELAAFLQRRDAERDGFWVALLDGEIVGSVSIDGSEAATEGARLRWFITSTKHQGMGIGKRLLFEALDFCRAVGLTHIYLTTFAGLEGARHLYEQFGFVLTREQEDATWGTSVTEQRYDLYQPGDIR